MRTFLLSVFWITNVGNVIQLLVIASASWIILFGSYSFLELDGNVFVTKFVPWLLWFKTFIIALLGDFGRFLLSIPILIIAPLKLAIGTMIGCWAYFEAKNIPVDRRILSNVHNNLLNCVMPNMKFKSLLSVVRTTFDGHLTKCYA
jgi:hypothetical protein